MDGLISNSPNPTEALCGILYQPRVLQDSLGGNPSGCFYVSNSAISIGTGTSFQNSLIRNEIQNQIEDATHAGIDVRNHRMLRSHCDSR
jgi:hypothetical protein